MTIKWKLRRNSSESCSFCLNVAFQHMQYGFVCCARIRYANLNARLSVVAHIWLTVCVCACFLLLWSLFCFTTRAFVQRKQTYLSDDNFRDLISDEHYSSTTVNKFSSKLIQSKKEMSEIIFLSCVLLFILH